MVWPPQSPDLNPIEQIWEHLSRQLEPMKKHSKKTIWESLQQKWKSIPVTLLRRYIDTMPERVLAVLKAKGGHTKY